jgi:hypothetical protein
MGRYILRGSLIQLGHGGLGHPDGFILQANLNACPAILGLVERGLHFSQVQFVLNFLMVFLNLLSCSDFRIYYHYDLFNRRPADKCFHGAVSWFPTA